MRNILAVFLTACAVLLPAPSASAYQSRDPLVAWTATPGTAWWVDPATGRTVVAVDDSVPSGVIHALTAAVRFRGGAVVREPGTLRKHIAGGDPFSGGAAARCLIGFNARALPDFYFMTSAHCVGPVGTAVFTGTTPLGVVAAVSPAYDHALVRYTDPTVTKPSAVDLYTGGLQPIASFGSGYVGQVVRRTGPNGVRSGTVTALNVTVNYADGAVYGLIRTNICSEPGDSGGPLFAGTVGIGITSGGSGSCSTGGTSYYASASRAAAAYGVSAY